MKFDKQTVKSDQKMINKPAILEHIKHPVNYNVLDVKWIPESANLCVVGADKQEGIIQCFQMNEGQLNLLTTVRRSKPMRCASFGFPSKRQVATGDISGRLQIM